jgi:excinuclease ABC subunit C
MDLHEKIRTLPAGPGVYLFHDADGKVIYVGKAKNLRSRVRSYFLEAAQANAKTGSLMREAVDLEYILVANEHEALALENNLIKQRKPRFNVLLRDDKTYPYVKLTLGDRYPKVLVTRRVRKDGAIYYGPYFPGNLAYRIVDLIHRFRDTIRGRACSTTFTAAWAHASKVSPLRTSTPKLFAMSA